jgi:hypothetical protein
LSYDTSQRIPVRKTGQDESQIQKGIKIKGDGKIRIAGAVMRVEVMPRKSGYGNDYKLKVWLPNFKEFEVTDKDGLMTFTQLMNALVEAATGQEPPKGAMETETHVENGFPMKIFKGEFESKETVTVASSSDPKTEPIVPFVPKKEDIPEEEKTEWNPTTQRYEPRKKALPDKSDKEDRADEDGTVLLDPKEVPAGAAKSEEDSVDLNAIAEDWHKRGYW